MKNIYKNAKENEFDNGVIYPIFNKIIKFLNVINLVEVLKKYICKLAENNYKNQTPVEKERLIRRVRNWTIDCFIISKFLFIIFIWLFNISNKFISITVIYLLLMNLHTYFYYHIWAESAMLNEYLSINRVRRRFINLFISFLYMVISYGYLYNIPFNYCFKTDKNISHINYLIYSVSNSFANSYDKIKPIGDVGVIIRLSQVIMTFIFITLILVCSMPKANNK